MTLCLSKEAFCKNIRAGMGINGLWKFVESKDVSVPITVADVKDLTVVIDGKRAGRAAGRVLPPGPE